MSFATVALRAPVVLVPVPGLDAQLRTKARGSAGLPPDVPRIVHDLNALEDGAATILSPAQGRYKASLLVHTRTYRLRLEPTHRGTGYLVKHIDALRLADHARLARSSLLVRPPAWHMVFELPAVPAGANAQWHHVEQAWQTLGREQAPQGSAGTLSETQTEFLDTVDRLIDATEDITTREQRDAAPFPYRRVSATAGQRRNTPQSVYEFQLVGADMPSPGDYVRVEGDTETRGKVSRAAGGSVTVRFDQPLSWDRLPARGALEIVPSTVVFAKQRQAVASLRTGDARNPGLLAAMAEHRVRPVPATSVRPHEQLDPEQLAAFRAALTTEDLLVVLGPPGTGKTRTITEIARTAVRAATAETGRVLVTSHTNRAVDNVLARLPDDLVVIRVGDAAKVHADVAPLLLEEQSENLSEGIQHAMAQRVETYRKASAVAPWTDELAARLQQVDEAAADVEAAAERARAAIRAAAAPGMASLTALQQQEEERTASLRSSAERAAWLGQKARTARQRSDLFLVGRFYRSRARRREAELTEVVTEVERLQSWEPELRRQAEAARAEVERAVREDPRVGTARAAHRAAEACLADQVRSAQTAGDMAAHALGTVVPDAAPPVLPPDPVGAAAALHALHAELAGWLPVLDKRLELAAQWQAATGQDPRQLVPELVRYAQVVGATCIGAASRAELSGVDFDLGIVDEAGQIGVADTLVPLTRVRRGVLVGDDQQLPPFRDSEVDEWARGTGDPELLRLMSQSALARLRAGLPSSHVVRLTRQRRMPAEIADFISAAFYGGTLLTEKDHRHTDLLFTSPMAYVDTAALPMRTRFEKGSNRAEGRNRKGPFNPCEARLLARLAAYYHRRGSEWVVIVPYLAQRQEVIRHLTPLIGDSQLAEASVGSVDSYQGGERDIVLYGFTRSNPHGRIGFLKELRRTNVAFSRAKTQLVLTGDLSTLMRADDPDFRDLVSALHRHLLDRGDLRQYAAVMADLDDAVPDLGKVTDPSAEGSRP
ncbi:AAA domain-containing protein [Streptomyces sp. NPDC046939]|uniref:DEAD/DEAH box helicase n=1 Tax=Streptomyces sp. NPDC046939 TaxID=3155376 RepID=UPI0033D352C4